MSRWCQIDKRYSAASEARWLRRIYDMPSYRRYAPTNARIREIISAKYGWPSNRSQDQRQG